MAGCLVSMASGRICFPTAELACNAAFHSASPDCHNLWGCLRQWGKDEFTLLNNFFTWGGHKPLKGSLKWSEGALQIFHPSGSGERDQKGIQSSTMDGPGKFLRASRQEGHRPESDSYLSVVPVLQEWCPSLAKLGSLFEDVAHSCVSFLLHNSRVPLFCRPGGSVHLIPIIFQQMAVKGLEQRVIKSH